MRIGKKRRDNKRLLRVSVSSPKDKTDILRKSKQLRRLSNFTDVYIQPDLTKMQQQQEFELRREVRERRMKGEDVVKYRGKVLMKEDLPVFQNES